MAIKITEECINCGACEPECPNNAIYEGGVEWSMADGTAVKGAFTLMDGSVTDANDPHTPVAVDVYYITPEKCTECQGFHDEPQCASVCPVDCCLPDELHVETEEQLLAIIDAEERNALGYMTSNLANDRKKAMDYYLGEPFGNEVEGRSEVVSRDVADTIEWIMPSLIKIFTSGDEIMRFEPEGPEDQQEAEQATQYINYIFQRQNNGFVVLHNLFKIGRAHV